MSVFGGVVARTPHGITLGADLGSEEEELGELRKGNQSTKSKEISLLESQVRRNGGRGIDEKRLDPTNLKGDISLGEQGETLSVRSLTALQVLTSQASQ